MFSWPEPFIWRALFAAVGLAIIAAPLGCIVVWRRMSYVGETLAQAGLLGVALGLALNIDLTLAVVIAAIVAAGILTVLGRQQLVPLDSALGLTHHATLALGIVAIALAKGPGIDLMSYLFGDVFAVTRNDLVWVYVGGAAVLGAVLYLWKPLVRLSLHEDLATAEGVNPKLPRAAFDLLLAVVIAVAMKIVGILLVMAFLVVPAVAARPLSSTPERMAVLAAGIAVMSTIFGLWLSLSSDLPGGPSIVIAMCTVAAISLLAGSRRQG
ncbi:metal ABC transporter permease [Hyphomicrobium sp.]|uniref:metal ABC transporter permease n=1 Tax=Hyphomicrobium sp. TaxID=82 RepID=UPI002C5DE48B|nr:metal ABC transporter permease [Hyphomicrobium sp.]HVZ06104.1 metal ABC transporter permease [Hyphomicrobium sp.]